MSRRQSWILLIPQTLFEKNVTWTFIGLLCSEGPRFLSGEEALFKHRSGIRALRPVTIDEDVTHIQTNLF